MSVETVVGCGLSYASYSNKTMAREFDDSGLLRVSYIATASVFPRWVDHKNVRTHSYENVATTRF